MTTETIDPVLSWLSGRGLVLKDDGGEWVDINCPWLSEPEVGHTTGIEAGYSPLGRGEMPMARGFNCFHSHPRAHGTQEFLAWVETMGGPKVPVRDPLPVLQARYAYVNEGQMVADLWQRPRGGKWLWTWPEFLGKEPERLPALSASSQGAPAAKVWRQDSRTVRFERMVYRPGEGAVVDDANQKCLNAWHEPAWPESDEAPEAFLRHIEFLLPAADERDRFLDWLAFKVQNPGARSYAIVMISAGYGVGRSWVKQMLESMLPGEVGAVSLPELIGKGTQFNGWASRKQLIVCEEARDLAPEDFYSGYEVFKQYVDTRPISFTCNPKYEPQRQDVMYFNVLIFSNHSDALVIPEEDRRVDVMTNPSERREPSYYAELEKALDRDEPQRLYWYLRRRDVSDFDHANPPVTAAKRRMIDAHASTPELVEHWIESHVTFDLVTLAGLKQLVRDAYAALDLEREYGKTDKVAERYWRKLGRLAEERHGLRLIGTVDGKQDRREVRAIRNSERHFGRVCAPTDVFGFDKAGADGVTWDALK